MLSFPDIINDSVEIQPSLVQSIDNERFDHMYVYNYVYIRNWVYSVW